MDRPSVTENLPKRVAVRITPDALRQVRAGHPWVYQNSVRSISPAPSTGDLAVIFDQKRKFAAIGLYDDDSAIAVRVLHAGAPTTIDRDWFASKIQSAIARRELLHRDPDSTAFRLVHGENDGLPGLVIDRYDTSLVVKIYSASWIPRLSDIADCLTDYGDRAYLRLARQVQRRQHQWAEGQLLFGSPIAQPIEFLENGLRFSADLIQGHKTGHFLDQRENRQRIRNIAHGKSVLDVFSCTGGFSVYCAAGGAHHVTAIDISTPALDTAEYNMGLNSDRESVKNCSFSRLDGDAAQQMEHLIRRGAKFDLIILDPPSYTSTAAHRDRARAQYENLTSLALQLLEPDGTLFQASCSSLVSGDELEDIVVGAIATHGWTIKSLDRFGQPIDHPIGFAQGEYLHAVLIKLSQPSLRRRGGRRRSPSR